MTNNPKYNVCVKNGAGWRQFPRIRLMISVGQPYHEEGKLEAVVNWINRNPMIEEVHVSVNDYLQRHNYYAHGISEKRADAIALSEGSLWLTRNEEILSGLNPQTQITRWNDWYNAAEYKAVRHALDQYAQSTPAFDAAIRADAEFLANRKANRGEIVPPTLVTHSADYLREELAVFAIQTNKLPAAEVYPGSNLSSAEFLLNSDLPAELKPLSQRHFTRIDFARVAMQQTSVPLPQLQRA